MRDRMFIDTSILVYAFDKSDLKKHQTVTGLLGELRKNNRKLIISVQVLLELYNVLTEFIENPILPSEAVRILDYFFKSEFWVKLDYTSVTASRATVAAAGCGVKIWDVLIAETMKENGLHAIMTENEKDFGRIPGITVENPFK